MRTETPAKRIKTTPRQGCQWLNSALVLLSVGLMACSNESHGLTEYTILTGNIKADTIQLERAGGGEKLAYITDTVGFYRIWVRRWEYRDTSIALRMDKAFADSISGQTIRRLFDGTTNISGTIPGEKTAGGTWLYIYIKNEGKWTRVANSAILNQFYAFETQLESLIENP